MFDAQISGVSAISTIPSVLSRIETKRTLEVVDLFEAISIWDKKVKNLEDELNELKKGGKP